MWTAARKRTYQILENSSPGDGANQLCAFLLLGLICLNVAAVVIGSIPSVHDRYGHWFDAFETFSIVAFSAEYVLRIWSSREGVYGEKGPLLGRLQYMVTPMAIVDLVAILPFFLAQFGIGDMRFLRVLRLLRLAKLTRYSKSVALLHQVMKEESRPIAAALFILLILLVIAASLAHLAEHHIQPESFGSIPQAMWWAVITMTTIGYGDVTPVTFAGKLIASAIGIIGLGMVALPAGLLAAGFTHKLHRQQRQFEVLVDEILKDGVVTEVEKARIIVAQAELDISADEAAELLEIRARELSANMPSCPTCGNDRRTKDADGMATAKDGQRPPMRPIGLRQSARS